MHGHDLGLGTAGNYRAFAEEASGRSPVYEQLAASVAEDAIVLGFLGSLPPEKRQPNLLFAAARYLLGVPAGLEALRALVSQNQAELAGVMLARRTQTNEPARCATLLPALAQLRPPLALIEVGASAGLTLLFDRYSYDFAGHRITGGDPLAPVLSCQPHGPVPLPDRIPEITWRAGLDLNPLDVTSDDDVRWLSCLVWPGEGDREQRLAAAIATARRDPPVIHHGDLRDGLPALAAQAPPGATRCHPGHLPLRRARLPPAGRPAGVRWRGQRTAGGMAVQRRTRRRARTTHTAPRGQPVRARPRRLHTPGPDRLTRNMAELAPQPRAAASQPGRQPVTGRARRPCSVIVRVFRSLL